MSENKGLLSSGLGMVLRNKRYIVWFYVLNLLLALFGTVAFVNQAGRDSGPQPAFGAPGAWLFADRADRHVCAARVWADHGFPRASNVLCGTLPARDRSVSARGFSGIRLDLPLASRRFLPRLWTESLALYPPPDGCWHCDDLATIALFACMAFLERNAAESTNELLLPEVRFIGLFIIFLIMTVFASGSILPKPTRPERSARRPQIDRCWLPAHIPRPGRLLASYVVTAIVAAIILVGGLWMWEHFVPPESVLGAFLIGQFTPAAVDSALLAARRRRLLLAAEMLVPVVVVEPVALNPFSARSPVSPAMPNSLPSPVETPDRGVSSTAGRA